MKADPHFGTIGCDPDLPAVKYLWTCRPYGSRYDDGQPDDGWPDRESRAYLDQICTGQNKEEHTLSPKKLAPGLYSFEVTVVDPRVTKGLVHREARIVHVLPGAAPIALGPVQQRVGTWACAALLSVSFASAGAGFVLGALLFVP